MIWTENMTKLRDLVRRERARSGTHTIELNNALSDDLAPLYWEMPVWGTDRRFKEEPKKKIEFSEFREKLRVGEFTEFLFRGIYVKWFCGDGETVIVPTGK
jgi:hypothetical protein